VLWSNAGLLPQLLPGLSLPGHGYQPPLLPLCCNVTNVLHSFLTPVLQVSNPKRCTRPHFEWANALLVVAVEQLLGFDCDLAAQEGHLREVTQREWSRTRAAQRAVNPLMCERMEAKVQHER
jgi:hypothetical protein